MNTTSIQLTRKGGNVGVCQGCQQPKMLLIPSVLELGMQLGHIPSEQDLEAAVENQGRCLHCQPGGWTTLQIVCVELSRRKKVIDADAQKQRRQVFRDFFEIKPGDDGGGEHRVPKRREILQGITGTPETNGYQNGQRAKNGRRNEHK